jgi:hypothetical protein
MRARELNQAPSDTHPGARPSGLRVARVRDVRDAREPTHQGKHRPAFPACAAANSMPAHSYYLMQINIYGYLHMKCDARAYIKVDYNNITNPHDCHFYQLIHIIRNVSNEVHFIFIRGVKTTAYFC